MAIHVLKVYNGTSWVTGVMRVWNGSFTWHDKLKYYDGSSTHQLYTVTVSPANTDIDYQTFLADDCHAFIEFRNNGVEYHNPSYDDSTPSVSRGNWLDVGNVSDVWISRELHTGTFDTDPGAVRLAMTSSRIWGNTANAETKDVDVTFHFYDAASGGNEIGSQRINVNADSV